MKSVVLKIKAKDLAEQAKNIRKEERKAWGSFKYSNLRQESDQAAFFLNGFESLVNYRRVNVRTEARATHLARMFIAGKPFREVEPTTDLSTIRRSLIQQTAKLVARYIEQPYHSNHVDKALLLTYEDVITSWMKAV